LSSAFEQFRARGIDYFVVDQPYNGGGLVGTAVLLNDLLGGAFLTTEATASASVININSMVP
jgi:hypothetical protein